MRWLATLRLVLVAGVVLGLSSGLALGAGDGKAPTQGAGAAETPSSLSPLVDKATRDLTNCRMECWLPDRLVGSDQSLTVAIRPTGSTPNAYPVMPRLVVQGEHRGHVESLTGTDRITIVEPPNPGEDSTITIDLEGALIADHYTGSLVTDVSTGAEPVAVPVDIEVREGPLLPLLLLLATVFLGALVTWIVQMRPKVAFKRSADQLSARISGLPQVEQFVLQPLWNDTWELRGSDFATAKAHLGALAAGADALRRCRDVQDNATRQPGALELTPWLQRIGSATRKVVQAVRSYADSYDDQLALVTQAQEDFSSALKAKAEVDVLDRRSKAGSKLGQPYQEFQKEAQDFRDVLSKAPPDASQGAPDLAPLVARVRHAFEALEKAAGRPLEEPPGRPVAAGLGAAAMVAELLGWPKPGAVVVVDKRSTWFDLTTSIASQLGAVVPLAVAIVLLAVGFEKTYLSNATFGAQLSDWLTLIFWGLAAYGARQALTGLGRPSAAA